MTPQEAHKVMMQVCGTPRLTSGQAWERSGLVTIDDMTHRQLGDATHHVGAVNEGLRGLLNMMHSINNGYMDGPQQKALLAQVPGMMQGIRDDLACVQASIDTWVEISTQKMGESG